MRLTWEEEHSAVEEEKEHTHFVRIVALGKRSTNYIIQLPLANGFELRGEIIYFDRNILVNATRALLFMRHIVASQQKQHSDLNTDSSKVDNFFLLKRTSIVIVSVTECSYTHFGISPFHRDIIKFGISHVGQPEVFNQVGEIVPFFELLQHEHDLDLVELIIDWGEWIPSGANNTGDLSTNPLKYAMEKDMEDLVHKLVKYCVKKTQEHRNQGYMTMVAECLEDISLNHPKLLEGVVQELSSVRTLRDSLPPYDMRGMLAHDNHYEISDIDVYRTLSKLQKYNPESWSYRFLTRPWTSMEDFFDEIKCSLTAIIYKEARELREFGHINHLHKKHDEGNLYVVPLPSLCVYEPLKHSVLGYLWHDVIRPRSKFIELVDDLNSGHAIFASPIFEAILNFKWHTYARKRYLFWFALFVLYFLSFLTVVSVEGEIVGSEWKGVMLDFTVLLSVLFLFQELRQAIYNFWGYIFSIYNYIDIGRYVTLALPLKFRVFELISSYSSSGDFDSKPTFVLTHTHFNILQLRISNHLGIFVAIVLDMVRRIAALLFVMSVLVVGFAQAFHILLRHNDDQEYPRYTGHGSPYQYENGQLAPNWVEGTQSVIDVVRAPNKATQMFNTFDQSLRAVYDFVGGDFGTLDGFRGNASLVSMGSGHLVVSLLICWLGSLGRIVFLLTTPRFPLFRISWSYYSRSWCQSFSSMFLLVGYL
ncbi:hypothetical protein BC936DRAFT_139259 [Jimgerdemannia flammicorona]|uniref:Ion transport domain-containing protein n=1 Tax=Jimgerdemannia flammicorona TaxID=994334 RepID=A0A433BA97_9FUNG|nr:hypothetical protein BC936DRAFT_139259 [Jimgerdemannia flammicorona]